MLACVQSVTTLVNRCGGLVLADEPVKPMPLVRPDGTRQLTFFQA